MAAAGSGARVGSTANKLLLPLAGKPVLAWSVGAICRALALAELVLVTREEMIPAVKELLRAIPEVPADARIVPGGQRRQDSVWNGLRCLSSGGDLVLIHDGARPLVTESIIRDTVAAASRIGAAVAATPLSDTVKSVDANGRVTQTLDRQKLWTVQTPQVFRREIIVEAHERSRRNGYVATDDAALVERMGHPVQLVHCRDCNLKITVPEDFPLAEAVLLARGETKPGAIRVGFGYDVHRFTPSRPLVLGGVTIENSPGLEGHSDADVLLHAICDALLGAAGQRDIGFHFPNTSTEFAGIASTALLTRVLGLLADAGYRVNNLDCTLIAERPRLSGYVPEMVRKIAEFTGIPAEQVSVKVTTNEGLGALGRGEGIACHAVASIVALGAQDMPRHRNEVSVYE